MKMKSLLYYCIKTVTDYLFTWNFVIPSLM